MIKNINKGRLINGDCLNELKHCPDNSIDLIVTDPPYGLFYYGLKWDKELPNLGIWKECHRVLKPGGFAFIMSSVRQDVLSRMIISLELAGFNTQFSSLYWTYSTGFPKAANIGVAIDKKLGVQSKIVETKIQERVKFKHMRDLGMKGQFCDSAQIKYAVKEPSSELGKSLNGGYAGFQPKPAVEAVLIAMKPLSEKTYVAQAIANSKGVTFLDSCRIPFFDKEGNLKQRVMSNLIVGDNALDLNEKELGVEIECVNRTGKSFRFSLDAWAKSTLPHLMVEKPRLNEKDFGLENLQYDNLINRKPGQLSLNVPMKSRPSDRKNIHPTVKPLKLMSYLTVLGSRPGDLVLDPFCGSGTTCLAARLLGRKFVGIEIEKEYHDIAKERLSNITRVSKKEEQVADKSENTKRLDKIASITLRCLDNSVIDLKEAPAIINEAIGNLVAGKRRYGLFEIDTNLRGSNVEPEKATESTSASPSIYQKMMSGMKKRRTRRGKPKVISVSRRTDIPALYSDWFFNRVKEGVALVKTKIDSPKITKVFLEPEDVRCFVFWTKNPGPMLARIDELDRYKYYFHFTLTPYGPDIEPNLPPKEELVETFIQLSKRIGKDRVIWRYDPIILTDTIDLEYHKQNFESMAKRLHKHTEKCVISFLKASKSALKAMGLKSINDDMKWELASLIEDIAEGYGLKVEACGEKVDFSERAIIPAKCVDPRLIGDITGKPVKIAKDTTQGKHCGCAPSIDIGTNDTCVHGCLYCYATKTAVQARINFHRHDKQSPALTMEMKENGMKEKEKDNVQDWADKGINISKGCSNNCRYCYARETSVRRHGNVSENWTNEQLNEKMIKKGWRKSSKSLMFPTTHDITPGTYDACELVLKKLLKAGNSVLVVSKPRPDLIERLCNALEPYKARMMFRFTISARNNEILSFWEPNAPSYEDRVESLIIAQSKGFKTSVSIEPMLDPADIKGLVEDLRDFTTDCMWIGPVKMIRKRTSIDSDKVEAEVQKIEAGQTPEKLLAVYDIYKDDPLIKWKGHFRKLLRGIGVEVPEQNDDWRDKL